MSRHKIQQFEENELPKFVSMAEVFKELRRLNREKEKALWGMIENNLLDSMERYIGTHESADYRRILREFRKAAGVQQRSTGQF